MILRYDKIVIGSSLSALMFAYIHELPVFFSEPQPPFRFEYMDLKWDLSSLKLRNEPSTLKTPKKEITVGAPKILLWERLMFVLSLSGNAPLGRYCSSMRNTGESIVFSDEYAKLVEVQFKYCYYFGDKNCHKLLHENSSSGSKYICYDWVAFNRGGKHKLDLIKTKDEFVKYIWFFASDRIDGNTPVKDACAVSYLLQEELLDFDYSSTMARFKVIHEMEHRGMKGKFNGYGPNGKPKYYKFRTSQIKREIRPCKPWSTPVQTNVEIMSPSEEELYKQLVLPNSFYNKIVSTL